MFAAPNPKESYTLSREKTLPPPPPYKIEKSSTRYETKRVDEDGLYRGGRANYGRDTTYKLWSWKKLSALWKCTEKPRRARSSTYLPEKNWKPVTLRLPILVSFIVISLSFIAILEVLSHYSSGGNGGGVAFAGTVDDLSFAVNFSYLYLPTIFAVIYSMFWNWIDLDVKRLEPWFQLSRSDGALARDSLLLHYPFEFLAFVPVRALRRRHWAVFFAGVVTMVIFWAITPLQSAIFSTGTVFRTRSSSMITTGSLLPVGAQITALNANFMNTAFGVTWLGQKLPPYTTRDYALQPFTAADSDLEGLSNGVWSASTIAYSTAITCKPANITLQNADINGTSYTFDDGNGCSIPDVALPATTGSDKFMVLYIQYWDNAQDDWALQNSNCSIEHSHNFLALWADADSQIRPRVYKNITGMFCQPQYFTQQVTAQINATDQAVVTSDFDQGVSGGHIDTLSDDTFNSTNFEYLIGTGVSSNFHRQDYPDVTVLEQFPRLLNYSIAWPVSNMVGFAIGANTETVADLSNQEVFQTALEKAHKILFSAAISALTTSALNSTLAVPRNGLLLDQPAAIVLVRTFAIVVEASLLLVSLFIGALWCYSARRESKMISDPAETIADIMTLTRNTKGLSHLFEDDGSVSETILEQRLCEKRFMISQSNHKASSSLALRLVSAESATAGSENEKSRLASSASHTASIKFRPVRPIELKLPVGFSLMAFIMGSICLLVVFYVLTTQNDGLSRPSANSLVLSFLENALPTAFASFLEPLWVVLNRLLCVLLPFEELRSGKASPLKTIRVKYTSLPPQLVFWRALQSRHLILAAVCAIAVSSNGLAVVLSVLFNEAPAPVIVNMVAKPVLPTLFNGSTDISSGNTTVPIIYSDHFYVTMSNLVQGTSLPPWIDQKFFYAPFHIPSSVLEYVSLSKGDPKVQRYSALTRAYGITTKCQPLETDGTANSVVFQPTNNGSQIELGNGYNLPKDIDCGGWGNQSLLTPGPLLDTASALEIVQVMAPRTMSSGPYSSDFQKLGFCKQLLVLGWVRVGSASSGSILAANNGTNGRSFETSLIGCSPQLLTAEFNVTVDPSGHILEVSQTSPFDKSPDSFSVTNETATLLSQINGLIAPYSYPAFAWHNDSLTSDWVNSMLKILLNSTLLVDPEMPVPDVQTLIPVVEDLYQRLAAVIIGLNTQIFTGPPPNTTLNITATIVETRIFMSPLAFKISIALLALHLITAIIYYWRRPTRFLPRMPTTIGSLIAYVSMSHAVEDTDPKHTSSTKTPYGYGHFIGVDGRPHVGIERQSLVIPLQSLNPLARRRKWSLSAWLQDRKEPQTWI